MLIVSLRVAGSSDAFALNRTRARKQTYVLDFQNTIEDIQTPFRPYFEATALEANSDPNLVYDLEGRLFKFGYLDQNEIERFSQTYYKGGTRRRRPREA